MKTVKTTTSKQPLVSVLMCTHPSRGDLAKLTIPMLCYNSQLWENKELIIIGDSDKNLAQKRNLGIQQAKGKYIIHFDDTGWSGCRRLSEQVSALEQAAEMSATCTKYKKTIHGYHQCYWYDTAKMQAYWYNGKEPWGATLCYLRSYALDHPWDETLETNEDLEFLRVASEGGLVLSHITMEKFVACQTLFNSQRDLTKAPWERVSNRYLPAQFKKIWGLA